MSNSKNPVQIVIGQTTIDTSKKDGQENPTPITTDGQPEILANNSESNDVLLDLIAPTDAEETITDTVSVSVTEVPAFADTNIDSGNVKIAEVDYKSSATSETEVTITHAVHQSTDAPVAVIIPASVPFPSSFTPSHKAEKLDYGLIDTDECFRSEEHTAMFNYSEEEEAEGTIESYIRFGRLKPVVGIIRMVNGKPLCALIDGNLYHEYAKAKGIKRLFACIITVNDQDDITKIMAQLQFSNHNSYMALFLIIQNLWPLFYKGQGYRSDLNDDQFDEQKTNSDGTRRPNIYEKIGKEIGLSGNSVKFIRKVGMVNSSHFKQIETTRHNLYAAYMACKNEVAGTEPAPPKPKAPTFIRTSTNNPPEFSTTNSTGVVPPDVNSPANNALIPAASSVAPTTDDNGETEFIVVRGVCESCGQETNIRISKSQLK